MHNFKRFSNISVLQITEIGKNIYYWNHIDIDFTTFKREFARIFNNQLVISWQIPQMKKKIDQLTNDNQMFILGLSYFFTTVSQPQKLSRTVIFWIISLLMERVCLNFRLLNFELSCSKSYVVSLLFNFKCDAKELKYNMYGRRVRRKK